MRSKTILYFDLETQLNSEDVGGWEDHQIREMRVSVGATYNSQSQEFVSYFEDDMPQLVAAVLDADLVVGFNVFRFDYVLLSRYAPLRAAEQASTAEMDQFYSRLCKLPTFDIINKVKNELGHFVSLSNIAKGTLGIDKSGKALDAVELWKASDDKSIKKLVDYCVHDVRLTRDIFKAGCQNKTIYYAQTVKSNNLIPTGKPIPTGNWSYVTRKLLKG